MTLSIIRSAYSLMLLIYLYVCYYVIDIYSEDTQPLGGYSLLKILQFFLFLVFETFVISSTQIQMKTNSNLFFFSNSYSYYNISPKVEHNMRVRVWYIWFNFKHFYFQFIFYMFRLPMLVNCILVHVCAVSFARIKLKQNNGSTT